MNKFILLVLISVSSLSVAKEFVFQQDTGNFYEKLSNESLKFLYQGYSGKWEYKNNPEYQNTYGGPIPRGVWEITRVKNTLNGHYMKHVCVLSNITVPCCLEPRSICNRTCDSFRIHGDSISHPGHASLGCVIIALDIREGVLVNDLLHVLLSTDPQMQNAHYVMTNFVPHKLFVNLREDEHDFGYAF